MEEGENMPQKRTHKGAQIIAIIIAILGIFVGLFGLVQIVMAGFSHDSTKRIIGVTCIIGGFTLCFAQQILTFLGMTTA